MMLKHTVRVAGGRRLTTQVYGDPDGRPVFLLHGTPGSRLWRRTGTFRAWRVSEDLTLRTLEGRATAHPGDWVVEGYRGQRWPVPDRQFRRGYQPAGTEPERPGPAAIPP